MPGVGNISWKRGQPLGLYPSFGSFALTHGLLILGLLDQEYDHQFFVLGDDVVILDTQLADKYMQLLSILGCPYSDSKTIRSDKLCEFAGKIVTSSQVIPQLKWRNCSDDSFLDIIRLLGPKAVELLRGRQKRVIATIQAVPEFLGGLGWNSKGLPLEERLLSSWVFDETYKPQPRVTDLTGEMISKLMKSSLVQSSVETLIRHKSDVVYPLPDSDLDQRSLSLTSSHMPALVPWYMLMGKNLDVVFHSLNRDLDLPIKAEVGANRPTQLIIWERRLNLQRLR
jgi:hypothetical protein